MGLFVGFSMVFLIRYRSNILAFLKIGNGKKKA